MKELEHLLDNNGEGQIGRVIIEECDTVPTENRLWHAVMDRQVIYGPVESPDLILRWLSEPITLSEAANFQSLAYSTLAQAAREGRIEARQHGKIWLTTRKAIERAVEEGKLKPRHKDS